MKKKITKTSEQAKREVNTKYQKFREKHTCPECGYCPYSENERYFIPGMLNSRIEKRKSDKLFGKNVEVEVYYCRKCGCEWEVED